MRNWFIAAALALLAGCTTGGPALEATGAARAQLEAAFAARDATAMAALYTEDAAVLAPNLPRIAGRPAIRGLWRDFLDGGVTRIAFEATELSAWGIDAAEEGRLALTGADGRGGSATIRGKYVLIWRRDVDGAWRVRRQIWNHDPPG